MQMGETKKADLGPGLENHTVMVTLNAATFTDPPSRRVRIY